MLSKSKIFLIFCLSFIVGVGAGRFVNYQTMAILAMVFVMIFTIGYKNKIALVIGLSGLIMLVGVVRFKTDYAQNDIQKFYGQKVQVTAVVVQEPDERSDKTFLTLGNLVINEQKVKSKLLLSVNRFPEREYGQKLTFETKIQEPKEFDDFNYKNYLSRFGIDAVASYPKITNVENDNFGNPIKLNILLFKKKFVDALAQVLPEPQNAFLGGLLLGAKHSIPQDLTDQFNRTGTSHIVAVSGYNITIIAGAIDALLMWFGLRKRLSFLLAVLAIAIFVIMTGATASVVRAGIMGTLLLVAMNIGRVNAVANSLAFTASLMLLTSPQILAFDIGFQLSFAALLGIVYIVPLIDKYFLWLPRLLRQYFLATLTAQIFTLPILTFYFGRLSIVALIANILVLPVVPITMLFGFITGFTGMIYSKLAVPFAAISWLLLSYIVKVIGFFASWSFATLSIRLNLFWLIVYYIILVSLLIWKIRRKNSYSS